MILTMICDVITLTTRKYIYGTILKDFNDLQK